MLSFSSPHIPHHKIIVLSNVRIFFIAAIIFVHRKHFHAEVFLWTFQKVSPDLSIHH